ERQQQQLPGWSSSGQLMHALSCALAFGMVQISEQQVEALRRKSKALLAGPTGKRDRKLGTAHDASSQFFVAGPRLADEQQGQQRRARTQIRRCGLQPAHRLPSSVQTAFEVGAQHRYGLLLDCWERARQPFKVVGLTPEQRMAEQ